jgi:hypothetical protein
MINLRPHTTTQARGSEDPDSLVLKNHDEFHKVQEIFINYTSFKELLDRKRAIFISQNKVDRS